MVRYSLDPENPTKCELFFPERSRRTLLKPLRFSFYEFRLFFSAACKSRGSNLRVHFKVRSVYIVGNANSLGLLF